MTNVLTDGLTSGRPVTADDLQIALSRGLQALGQVKAVLREPAQAALPPLRQQPHSIVNGARAGHTRRMYPQGIDPVRELTEHPARLRKLLQ